MGSWLYPRGRLARRSFFLFALPTFALAGLVMTAVMRRFGGVAELFVPDIVLAMMVFSTAAAPAWPLMIRRLNDTGGGGALVAWLLGLVFGGGAFFVLMGACSLGDVCEASPLMVVGALLIYTGPAALGFLLAPMLLFPLALAKCLWPSDPTPNRYGPPPEAPA